MQNKIEKWQNMAGSREVRGALLAGSREELLQVAADARVLLNWKWLKNLTNGFNMCEMTYIFGNWHKCLRNG